MYVFNLTKNLKSSNTETGSQKCILTIWSVKNVAVPKQVYST